MHSSKIISGPKGQPKERVVQIYDSFFRGEDLLLGNPNLLDELILLKPKVSVLETKINKLDKEQLVALKDNINTLFRHCVVTLGNEDHLRAEYALRTLCAVIHNIYRKTSEFHFGIINVLIGCEVADETMQILLDHCRNVLTGDYSNNLKNSCLILLLVMVTGKDNVSQNFVLEYLMDNSIFGALIQLLNEPTTRTEHGYDAVVLLMLLINYRKYELSNPYSAKLSVLEDELALNGFGQVITSCLTNFCCRFIDKQVESQHQSVNWLSLLTNMVNNMFTSEADGVITQEVRTKTNAVLVALYEAVYLNHNFITILAHTQSEKSASPSGLPIIPAVDLLITLFQYSSIVMQDSKSEANFNNVKLCMLILTCISEDEYSNFVMHDVNLAFEVKLQRLPPRHRKLAHDGTSPSQPLASTLLDLLVEFIMSHKMDKLPMELYLLCVGVIHRLLCYQKSCCVRLHYDWKVLWTSLITLLNFLLNNENDFAEINIFHLALQIVGTFNLFIIYGDKFLTSTNSYDALYCKFVRMHIVFENLYSMALKYSANDGEFKDNALRLKNSLINIRTIINHFLPKIDASLACQASSKEKMLDVVGKNYGNLTLKLQEGVDQYDRYSENPYHTEFFIAVVCNVVRETRQNIDFASLELFQ